jgi:hypothetical protein
VSSASETQRGLARSGLASVQQSLIPPPELEPHDDAPRLFDASLSPSHPTQVVASLAYGRLEALRALARARVFRVVIMAAARV